MDAIVFDIETDGLDAKIIHVMSWSDGVDVHSTNDHEVMRNVLLGASALAAHNCSRFDLPVLERILGIKIPKETLIVDTMAISWYLQPNRRKHSLESYGEEYGIEKPKIDDWFNLDYSVYKHRCETDVKINVRLWKEQYKHLKEIYGNDEDIKRFLRYLAFKLDCARAQEESGWKLDIPRAQAAIAKLEALQEEKIIELRAAMPAVPIVVTRNRPKVLRKANGDYSEHGLRWVELCNTHDVDPGGTESIDVVTGYNPPNPTYHEEVKQWLFGLGWKPRTFKENKKGKEIPQINKSKQDGGGVCESVLDLLEKEPAIESLDGLFVLGHRLGILRGFLDNVDEDGFVHARVMGLTNTLRFKHTEVVNLPKPDAPYGEDVRGCLIAPDGEELCGSDMSSLEDRTKQHYMWKHDPEYVKEMMKDDFDPHLDLALSAGKMTQVDVKFYKSFKSGVASVGDHARYKLLKTLRGIFKNTNYAATYGAFPPKIAKTAGVDLAEGTALFDAYWKRNWSLKKIAAGLKTKLVRGQQWLFNPVSRFWYSLRKEKDKFSTLNQGTGVYCFDVWLGFVRSKRPQLTGQFHDEIILCVKKGYRDEVTAFLKECIDDANEFLNLNRKLDIGIDFGNNYAEIH